MKRIALSLLIVLISSAAFSQKLYFVYLQAEPEQSFYVKLNERFHSSSASGYLILSRLHDSIYAVTIGFPQNKWPEQKFLIEVKGKDRGYSLRNFGEKGWGLYDLETMSIQMGTFSSNVPGPPKTESKDVSVFTDILSKAANDPSLKEKSVIVKEEKPSVSPPVAKDDNNMKQSKDSAVAKQDQQSVQKTENPPAVDNKQVVNVKEEASVKKEEGKSMVAEEKYKPSVVSKRSESSTTQGLTLTYIDDYGNGKKDTISIIIPNQKVSIPEAKATVKEEKKFLDISTNDSVKTIEPDQQSAKGETGTVSSVIKNNCTLAATENDFLKLRRKMASVNGDDEMVSEARKVFKAKCFSTVQVKNLGTLFLNDEGKYKFFDAAYTHVTDIENFPSLATEIKDEYYLNRFKVMLR